MTLQTVFEPRTFTVYQAVLDTAGNTCVQEDKEIVIVFPVVKVVDSPIIVHLRTTDEERDDDNP